MLFRKQQVYYCRNPKWYAGGLEFILTFQYAIKQNWGFAGTEFRCKVSWLRKCSPISGPSLFFAVAALLAAAWFRRTLD